MTDFFADLEAELTGAARRRAAGAPAPRRLGLSRLPRLTAPAVALAVVLAALAVVLGARPDVEPDEAARRGQVAPGPAPVPPNEAYTGGACDPERAPLRAPGGPGPAAVLEAIPALPRDPRKAVALPRAAVEALQDLQVRAAYVDTVAVLPVEGEVTVSVVPVTGATPCAEVRPTGTPAFEGDGACLLAVERERLLAAMCQPAAAIRRGRFATRQAGRRTVVLGFARSRATPGALRTAGGGVGVLRWREGIVAEVIGDVERAQVPSGTGVIETLASPGTVAVLNGTTESGLASRLMERLEGSGIEPGAIESLSEQDVRRSRVLYVTEADRPLARLAADRLGIERVERGRAPLAGSAAVTVIAGADLARAAGPRVAVVDTTPRVRGAADPGLAVMKRLGLQEIAGVGRPALAGAGSRVLHAPGEREAAEAIARKLGVSAVRPREGDPAGRVAKEPVIVVVDEDLVDRLR